MDETKNLSQELIQSNQAAVTSRYSFINVNMVLVFIIGILIPIAFLFLIPIEKIPYLNKKIFTMPIDPDEPYIENYGLVYFFKGQVKEVKKDGTNIELITDIEGRNIPKFMIKPATTFFKEAQVGFEPTSINTIQIGQTVSISAYYSEFTKWNTTRVSILK